MTLIFKGSHERSIYCLACLGAREVQMLLGTYWPVGEKLEKYYENMAGSQETFELRDSKDWGFSFFFFFLPTWIGDFRGVITDKEVLHWQLSLKKVSLVLGRRFSLGKGKVKASFYKLGDGRVALYEKDLQRDGFWSGFHPWSWAACSLQACWFRWGGEWQGWFGWKARKLSTRI